MALPRVWKLLDTVGCEDIYEFLGMDRDASLEELRAAAEKKYVSIHNQSSRNDVARAGAELAGLCKSDIFKDGRSKRKHDEELDVRSRADAGDGRRRSSGSVGRGALVFGTLAVVAVAAAGIAGIALFLSGAGEGTAGDGAGRGVESISSIGAGGVEAGSSGADGSGPDALQAGDADASSGAMGVAGGATPSGADGSPATVEDALRLDGSARRRIQAGLSSAGFAPGPADGVFGSGTREAIRRWQAARGGAATGYLNAIEAAELSALGGDELRASSAADERSGRPSRPARAAATPPTRDRQYAGAGGGTLTVRAAPASRVELDGADVGTTGATGMLVLSDVQPGRHVVVARKEGHSEATSVVEVAAGRAEVLELALAPLPGRLSVTADVAGALLRVGDAEQSLPLRGLELPAGSHRVTVSREGFTTVVRQVEIRPGADTTLDLRLEPAPIDDLLQAAAGQLAAGNYRAAVEAARSVVSMRPDAGEAHRLLGTALYERGDFEESIRPLSQAIRLGQEVVLSTRHRHGGGGLREGFCNGTITLSRNAVTFVSRDEPEHGFSTTPDRLTGVRVTQSAGRNAFRVNASLEEADGGRRRRNFDFVHRNAVRARREPDSLFLVLTCRDCDASLDVQAALMNYVSQLAP